MSLKDINTDAIGDDKVIEAIETIKDALLPEPLINSNFSFFSITITGAVTNLTITHGLGFLPLDVIQTSLTGAGTLTWNYANFTLTTLSVTTTGSCVVRAFIGAYRAV